MGVLRGGPTMRLDGTKAVLGPRATRSWARPGMPRGGGEGRWAWGGGREA